ncbi:hypothetical protein EJ03DRAFT_320126 [Teratosphaeria nubilosa]|uniref:Mitochondrial import inner membrane translocase subunit TIM54 n=1 Tax=Teratosphaeria nubilosa TaxID=161662 RepID=A0A6G1KWQ1_9PEZI|nr:hypothetical protein EJ03DRAFT_320126 [Teratosphaeria nubilosa]
MSDKPGASHTGNAASAAATSTVSDAAATASAAPQKAAAAEGNPAFRMMGLPRLRLPSRNWMIFLSITGSFAGAVIYDKWQMRRIREKWCKLVQHIAEEPLDSHTLPRRLTVYLAAPPADGVRGAREHFHDYVKPILVAAAMDWDAVEGRKEGDVRYKTAERVRRKRKRAGEGVQELETEEEKELSIDVMRQRNGTKEFDGLAGDIVIGRNTWKEYIRGVHEGWLGPVDAPKQPEVEGETPTTPSNDNPGHLSLGDAAIKGAANVVEANTLTSSEEQLKDVHESGGSEAKPEDQIPAPEKTEEEKKEEEKLKPRFPPPYITPEEYPTATLSPNTPDMIGPSTAVTYPHLLGIRNTPIRIYRFLTRRYLADSIGREVAAAVLASQTRPYSTTTVPDQDSVSGREKVVPEQVGVLAHEERDWWKTVREPRKEHEESVWIEGVVVDERLAGRMRRFELGVEEERSGRIAKGEEAVGRREGEQ